MKPLTPELYQQVCAVLFQNWDPIGINDHAPADEYDSYAPELIRLVRDGADEYKVAARLGELARVSMGLSPRSMDFDRAVARKLIELVRG